MGVIAGNFRQLRDALEAKKRIKKLESLLAEEIQAVADLLKENQRLESELETTQNQLNAYKKYYEHEIYKNTPKIDRYDAMAVFARSSSHEDNLE